MDCKCTLRGVSESGFWEKIRTKVREKYGRFIGDNMRNVIDSARIEEKR